MRRGPEPKKGFEVALPAALRRGRVMHFRSSPEYVSNFMVYGNGLVLLVCLRLARRLSRATLAEIRTDYAIAIAGLSTVPCGGPVSRELWLYSRHGAMRFFRVGTAGLEEIDRDGVPFVNGKPVGTLPGAPDNAGSPAPSPVDSKAPGPDNRDPRSPIIRWLKKMNAVKAQAAEGTGATGTQDPEIIPVSGGEVPGGDERVMDKGPAPPSGIHAATGIPAGVPASGDIPDEPGLSRTPGKE